MSLGILEMKTGFAAYALRFLILLACAQQVNAADEFHGLIGIQNDSDKNNHQRVYTKNVNGVAFHPRAGQMDITIDGAPFATYVWSDPKTTRPYFKQVHALGGKIQITRNHPPQANDLADHETYHPGIWWGFGDIGGNDYWRLKAKVIGGSFIEQPTGGPDRGSFAVRNRMLSNDGQETFCFQVCRYTFLKRPIGILMICESTFTRDAGDFWLGDQEEMGMAIRVATPIATKSEKGGVIRDSQGRTEHKQIRTNQSDWCDYSGPIGGKHGGILLMNDPANFRKPWWHAVDTGLLIANPLGESELSGRGKKRQNVLVEKGKPFRLRYGVLIHLHDAKDEFDPAKAYADFLAVLHKVERSKTSATRNDLPNVAEKQASTRLHLKVDFAAASSRVNSHPIPGTAKDGWWHWVTRDWDLYRSDLTWEDRSSNYPAGGPGIAGSGVHASMTCNYEGIMTTYVAGMRRFLAGGLQPQKQPVYEPICNSWIAASDFPNNPSSDLLLSLYDLPPGHYRLVSYHNSFNCRRIGDNPTGVECTQAKQPEPPMPSIKVYAMKSIVADYFQRPTDARELPKGKPHGTSRNKVIVPGKQGTGNVRQTLGAKNVKIQQVKTDAELTPSIIEFTTDGSPLVVVYAGGSGKKDDLRPHRHGGYAVLNAFELIQLSEVVEKSLPSGKN